MRDRLRAAVIALAALAATTAACRASGGGRAETVIVGGKVKFQRQGEQ